MHTVRSIFSSLLLLLLIAANGEKMKNYTHFGALRLFNKKIDDTNSIFISRLKRELYRTQNSQQQHHHEHDHVPAVSLSDIVDVETI